MENKDRYIMKAFSCEKCGRMVECKIEKKQIEELKESQLFNFVLMHADDHTLILSIDSRGNIRRSRVASLSSDAKKETSIPSFQDYPVLEECNNLVDAFNVYLKNTLPCDE
ncbi:MAG: hypothetical protein H7641_07750 [Candidatus Heimdallarchaeota archaeon]|nr:hypothetical protein [Candidatus Heimdallarchaeota archaeon]MCK4877457.1 hypothetical protein [Candidatus Heimdallarchaeota archaeon]